MKITCECVDDSEGLYNLTIDVPAHYRPISTVLRRLNGEILDALAEVITKVRKEKHGKAVNSRPPVPPWNE